MKRILIFAVILMLCLFAGCEQKTGPETTTAQGQMGTVLQETQPQATPAVTQPDIIEPEQTEPTVPKKETQPIETEPEETEPTASEGTEPTEPIETEPVSTEPPQTQPEETQPIETQPEETKPPQTVTLTEEAAIPNNITAVASGSKVKSNAYAAIDYSNTDDGYVMVRYTAETTSKLKAQVKGPDTTYTYSLTPQQWAAFPLSDENGDYQISIYENVTANKYAVVLSVSISVSMEDEFAPFLRSNQYVNFDNAPNTVAKARSLCSGTEDSLKKVERVYDFVVSMTYDQELANNVQSGYTPNLDRVLSRMSGICFDYAALMTGMLRSQGVPAKLVIGYAGDAYHAWINVWSESTGWVDGVIYFDGVHWKRMDPTFASSGGSGMLDYIGNGSNYTAKYFY